MKQIRVLIIILSFILSFLSMTCQGMAPEKYIKLSDEALACARYAKAIELSTQFLNDYINTASCTSDMLIRHMNNLRDGHKAIGDTKGYEIFCTELFRKIDPSRKSTLIRCFILISLTCKGEYAATSMERHSFSHFGDNRSGIQFFDTYYKFLPQDILQEKPIIDGWLHIILADLLSFGGQFDEAKTEIELARRIIKGNTEQTNPIQIIPGLATEILQAQQGLWQEAIESALINKSEIERLSTDNKEYYALAGRLANYYYQIGDYKSAAKYAQESDIRASVFDRLPTLINYRALQGGEQENSPANIFANQDYNLNSLIYSNTLFASTDKEAATNKATKLLLTLQKDIAGNYSKFAFNRAGANLKNKVNMLINTSASLALKNPEDQTLQGISYNAGLIYKQLSHSSSNLYRNIASKTGNPVFIKRIKELELSKMMLDNIDPALSDSLISRISQLESNLERNLKSRSNVSLTSLPDWMDIRSALKPHEAAVEFFIAETDSGNVYTASILKADSPFPKITALCQTGQIDKLKYPLSDTRLFSLLWQPLEKDLKDISTIYFSPIGYLSLIPIEYVPIDNSFKLNDKFSMYRLSSTQELLYRFDRDVDNEILLYGGVKYDLDPDELKAKDSDVANTLTDLANVNLNIEEDDTNRLRAGIKYLPATLEEVNMISNIYEAQGLIVSKITGTDASESSVRRLNGKRVPTLHIATHGFALNTNSRSRLGRLLARKERLSITEEQNLSRSGLMLAGAANTINDKSDSTISNVEDGILTALEISRLDLSGIDMVVLSTCESGIGKIESEGVAGLQRGFKIAGVRSLVVSLWKVDDEATSLLMTSFYQNRLAGYPPAIALRNAQEFIKSHEGGKYDSPDYWGAFIILDAI